MVVATTLTSCSSPVSWPLEAGELAPGHGLAQRERSGIASIEDSQSQSQGLVLTISFVSRAYTKLSAKLQTCGGVVRFGLSFSLASFTGKYQPAQGRRATQETWGWTRGAARSLGN